jgi:hypothetical protein
MDRTPGWHRAIDAISRVTHAYPSRQSFAAFGTVLSPHNLLEIPTYPLRDPHRLVRVARAGACGRSV